MIQSTGGNDPVTITSNEYNRLVNISVKYNDLVRKFEDPLNVNISIMEYQELRKRAVAYADLLLKLTPEIDNQRTNTYPPPEDRDSAASVGISTYNPLHRDAPQSKTIGSNQITALEEARKVIYGEREQTYGDPGKNLRVIAEYWSVHLKAKYNYSTPLTPDDVCVMMVLLKQARLANTPKHRDSIVDTIGYAALADRVNVAEQEAEERNTPISK